MLQAGFEPELSGISARRLLQFGLPQRNQCHRWDWNPHYPDSETGASCRLGYRGNSAEAAGVEPAGPRKGPPGFRDQSPRQWGQSFQYSLLATRFSLLFKKSTTGVEPVRIRACNPAADRRHRARRANHGCGRTRTSVGLIGRLQIYSLAQSPLCHTPKTKDEGGKDE